MSQAQRDRNRNLATFGFFPRHKTAPATVSSAPPGADKSNGSGADQLTPLVSSVDLAQVRTAQGVGVQAPFRVQLAGNFLAVNDSTFPTDRAKIRIGGRGDYMTVGAGWSISGPAFDYVDVINAAQAGSTLELVVAMTTPKTRIDLRYR